jgi:hypothetical protein
MIPEKEQNEFKASLTHLKQEAIRFGATDSAVIASGDIRTDDDLAALCNGEYTCPNFGLAASCPPHVEGPEQFRKWQEKSRYSITVKIELPASVMFSDGRKEVMRLLHQVVAGVEKRPLNLDSASRKPLLADHASHYSVKKTKRAVSWQTSSRAAIWMRQGLPCPDLVLMSSK